MPHPWGGGPARNWTVHFSSKLSRSVGRSGQSGAWPYSTALAECRVHREPQKAHQNSPGQSAVRFVPVGLSTVVDAICPGSSSITKPHLGRYNIYVSVCDSSNDTKGIVSRATPHKEGSRRLPPTEKGGWVGGWTTVRLGSWSAFAKLIEKIGPVEVESE